MINYNVLIRFAIVGAIGIFSFLILVKLITWPERSKAKRTGQILDDTNKINTKAVLIYITIWLLLLAAGAAAIIYLK
jgi:predicted MFS family arabinose efflux permease